ncbi:AAA family ATPase [Ruminococcus sp.]|uniref:AAA family ATPase n=1 Tax=Ruminococcus sp. TaxID=41978 RepID=UPI0025E1DB4D|nr:AAA family ATPase [Ruminococcus sp.]
MLKDIVGITLSGASYTSDTDLAVFNPIDGKKTKKIKGSIIYGRNGSGKSSIAKGFRKIKDEEVETINKAVLFDINNKPVTLNESDKTNIAVFDEDYVDKNVKLKETGLGSIIMLGDLADLSDKINKAQIELDEATKTNEQIQEELEKYNSNINPKSPKYYISKMISALSGDKHWSGREREIDKNRRTNAPVYDQSYKQFIKHKPSKTKDELILEYNEKIIKLRDMENGKSHISSSVPTLNLLYKGFNIAENNKLLFQRIEKPQLSERERFLLQLVQEGKTETLQNNIDIFKDNKTHFCPTCLQDIQPEYKQNLINSIEKILSKKVEEHQTQLRSLILPLIDLDLCAFDSLSSYQSCIKIIEKINNSIELNNDIINKKINNPYSISNDALNDINEDIKILDELLTVLNNEVKEHNNSITNTEPLKSELKKINAERAYYDVEPLYELYNLQLLEYNQVKARAEEAEKICEEKRIKLQSIESKMKKTKIAHDMINDALKYIFFSDNRLQIGIDNNEYILFVNGNQVKPSEVSVGERNILGLCYFFTSMLQNKEKDDAFKDEYLIVIDDPISSFDVENKVGILSYLKWMLGRFIFQNENTKFLIMTHDLTTFFDINKICKEYISKIKKIYNDSTCKCNVYELKNQNLEPFNSENRQEYTELLEMIYSYASGDTIKYEVVIGNIMRQVLEAFSTFVYKKGIEEVSTDSEILSTIPEEYRLYYDNLMYRLVLHGGSHRKEQTQNMELNFFALISENEKRRTAKDILTYIYLLNPKHICSHLPSSENTIKTWCNEIKNRYGVNT